MKRTNVNLQRIQQVVGEWIDRNAYIALRISLGVVFFWFGFLKFFPDVSPAQDVATRTISVMTFGLIPERLSILLLATWECAIGIGFLTGRFQRFTLILLFGQMIGTFTPLFFFPGEVFRIAPIVPTLEGQYIIKNIVIVSAGLVIGARVLRNR